MAQHSTQGNGCSHIYLCKLDRSHLGLSTLAEVDSAQRQGQSPQAAALGQLSYEGETGTKIPSLKLSKLKVELNIN